MKTGKWGLVFAFGSLKNPIHTTKPFNTYQQAHARCDRLHPNEEIPFGPFSGHVRTVLNEHCGYERLRTTDAPGGEDDAPAASPAPAPDRPEGPGAPGAGRPAPTPPLAGDGDSSGDGAASAEPAPAREEPAEAPGESQAMADHYRSVAEAQRRNDDGEVRL